ncbi:MAG TPA: superoxide dismutase family protein [Chthoniobacterales bacterium]|nr:superoxide dismutase family protein [Chthoniobacterales bacterium]
MKTIILIAMFCSLCCFAQAQEVMKAVAQIGSSSNSKVTGTVSFTKVGDEVQVVADVQNLTPGKHGFHIHEKGDCSAPDASSAGAHFNPTMKHHGGPMTADHHTGDLGNIEADSTGKAHLDWKGKLSLSGADSIIGKSIVVHEKEDDLKTDPSGNSGARIGCGVINASN